METKKSHLRRINDFLKEHRLEFNFITWIITVVLLWLVAPELHETMFRAFIIFVGILSFLFITICSAVAIIVLVFWMMERYLRKTEMETKKEREEEN